MSPNFGKNRSKVKVTGVNNVSVKMCHNAVTGGPPKFVTGG